MWAIPHTNGSDLPDFLGYWEAAELNRLMAYLEDRLAKCQFAHRRERCAEHHLIELTGFNAEQYSQKRRISIVSTDVDGAFDTVPH